MAITALPTPPSRSDPINFATQADAFLGALPTFQVEANALETNVNAKEVSANSSASNASASAINAANSAATVVATANATKWISGTTYVQGANVWSPIDFQTYRRAIAGAGTTDPSLDPTNWVLLSTSLKEKVVMISTATNAQSLYTYVLTATLVLTLPAAPNVGDWVIVSNRSATSTASVARNTKNIMGLAEDLTIDSLTETFKMIYTDTTRGWIIL